MPCTRQGHDHQWVTEGMLLIERCEKICQWCTYVAGERNKKTSSGNYPCALRRHVAQKHAKHFPNLVMGKWAASPTGNKKSGKKGGKKAKPVDGTTPGGEEEVEQQQQQGEVVAGMVEMGGNGDATGVGGLTLPQTQLPVPDFDPQALAFMPEFFPEMQVALPAANVDESIDPSVVLGGNDFNFNGIDVRGSISTSSPESDGTLARWITPQNIRTNGMPIIGILPVNWGPAMLLAEGMDGLIQRVGPDLTDGEIAHVLETYAEAFKRGVSLL